MLKDVIVIAVIEEEKAAATIKAVLNIQVSIIS